jgi:hypothetical protein
MAKSSKEIPSYNYNGIYYSIYSKSIISGNPEAGAFVCNNPDGKSHCTYLTHKEYNKIFKSISTKKTGTICKIKNDNGKVIWNIKAPFNPDENTHKRCNELNDGKFMCFYCMARNNTQNWGLAWHAKFLPDRYKQNEKKKNKNKKSSSMSSKKKKKPSLNRSYKNTSSKYDSKKIIEAPEHVIFEKNKLTLSAHFDKNIFDKIEKQKFVLQKQNIKKVKKKQNKISYTLCEHIICFSSKCKYIHTENHNDLRKIYFDSIFKLRDEIKNINLNDKKTLSEYINNIQILIHLKIPEYKDNYNKYDNLSYIDRVKSTPGGNYMIQHDNSILVLMVMLRNIMKNKIIDKVKLIEKLNSTIADIDDYCKKYKRSDIDTNTLNKLNHSIKMKKLNNSIKVPESEKTVDKNKIYYNTIKEEETKDFSNSVDTVDFFEESGKGDLNVKRQDSEEIICLGLNHVEKIESLSNTPLTNVNNISDNSYNISNSPSIPKAIKVDTNFPPPGMYNMPHNPSLSGMTMYSVNYNSNQSPVMDMYTMNINLPPKETIIYKMSLPERISAIENIIDGRKSNDPIISNRMDMLEIKIFGVINGSLPLLNRIEQIEEICKK